MMNVVDLLQMTKGGRALMDHGQTVGLSKGDMVGAFGKLVPALATGLERHSQASGHSVGDVVRQLGAAQLAGAVDADDADALAGFRSQGEQVISALFGSQERAQSLASRVGESIGLDVGPLQALLPLVAGLFIGALGKIDSGSFKPSGGGMMATMAVNMLMSSGGGAAGLMKFIDTDSVSDLLAGLLD